MQINHTTSIAIVFSVALIAVGVVYYVKEKDEPKNDD